MDGLREINAKNLLAALREADRLMTPPVAVSDGSQDVNGYAPLAGTPLPPGFRAAPIPGWTQDGIAPCVVCGKGTIWIAPDGIRRHRGCE